MSDRNSATASSKVPIAQGSAPSFSAGTLTLPSNTSYIVTEVWGGGGGGGGGDNTGGSTNVGTGGAGGGGGYSQKLYVSPSGTYFYNIGAGGGGGAVDSSGNPGGISSFGTGLATTSATGGGGGTGGTAAPGSPGYGGAGGGGAGGDVNLTGNGGGSGELAVYGVTNSVGGAGGSAPRGGGGGNSTNSVANGGSAFGGGAAGGSVLNVGAPGGAGGLVITVYATSSPNAAGNDYAEMFPVSSPIITAGDIVAVDAGVPVSMKLAAVGDGAPLAGIIATDPGQLLGDKEAVGSRPVPLSGRVPAKVNLEGGPIAIGDRIAPSSVPGVGKKAGLFDDSVGIALESFSGAAGSSQGSVTVFLDLQRGIDINAIAFALLGPSNPIFAASSTSSAASSTHSTGSGQASPLDFVGGMMNAFSSRMDSLANLFATSTDAISTVATATSTPSDTYASGFLRSLFAQVVQWLANASNGISNIFAKVGNFGRVNTDELCVGATCVDE